MRARRLVVSAASLDDQRGVELGDLELSAMGRWVFVLEGGWGSEQSAQAPYMGIALTAYTVTKHGSEYTGRHTRSCVNALIHALMRRRTL